MNRKKEILNLIEDLKRKESTINSLVSKVYTLELKVEQLLYPAKFTLKDKVKIKFSTVTQQPQYVYFNGQYIAQKSQPLSYKVPTGIEVKDENKVYKINKIEYNYGWQYEIISCANDEIVTYKLTEDYLEKVK